MSESYIAATLINIRNPRLCCNVVSVNNSHLENIIQRHAHWHAFGYCPSKVITLFEGGSLCVFTRDKYSCNHGSYESSTLAGIDQQ